MTITLPDIEAAQRSIAAQIQVSPCTYSKTLSAITGAELYLKLETEHFTASFKERGALNKLLTLNPNERKRGVVAMSAGNHAQAVAYHATRLGIPSTVVMPRYTPTQKVESTRVLGAQVELVGDDLETARDYAHQLRENKNFVFVHPYDDPWIIAGQGTVALELLEQVQDLDAVIVPVGGGGLISGMAVAINTLKPALRVIGVQAERYAAVKHALEGKSQVLGAATLAEGIAVKRPGELTLPLIQQYVDEVNEVSEEDIERAMILMLQIEKRVVEGAGAAALAEVLARPESYRGKKVALIISGANLDTIALASVIHRDLVRSRRLVRIHLSLNDQPGALSKVVHILAEANANIEEIHHQRAFSGLPAKSTQVEFVLQTRGPKHVESILSSLCSAGYDASLVPLLRPTPTPN